jgi:hypothetical protein
VACRPSPTCPQSEASICRPQPSNTTSLRHYTTAQSLTLAALSRADGVNVTLHVFCLGACSCLPTACDTTGYRWRNGWLYRSVDGNRSLILPDSHIMFTWTRLDGYISSILFKGAPFIKHPMSLIITCKNTFGPVQYNAPSCQLAHIHHPVDKKRCAAPQLTTQSFQISMLYSPSSFSCSSSLPMQI